ncbi:MAG: transglutaminase family protein [Thiobacillus sp.]
MFQVAQRQRVSSPGDWQESLQSVQADNPTPRLATLPPANRALPTSHHTPLAPLNIPARFCSGIDYGADPVLGPTDFHAYVEVLLGGRWYIFDASGVAIPMGFVRIGTGRDAADISFATIFGVIKSDVPVLAIDALSDPAQGYVLPWLCPEALSTDVLNWLH